MRKRQARHQRIASKSRRRRHAAHVGGSGRITGNSTVWVSSAGWRDSDTSMQVIGTDKAVVQKKIDKMMKDEAKRAYEEGEEFDYGGEQFGTVDDAMSGIAFYGEHKFALKDIVSARELPEAIRELSSLGYYYPEM